MIALRRVSAPLGGRAFRLLWLGQSISAFGTALQLIAVIWLVQERTDSAIAVSGVALSTLLPRIALALLGGVVADRFSATGVMVWADAARALLVFLMVGLLVLDVLPLPLLYALLAANAAAGALFDPAAASVVPQLVPASQLQAANSVNRLTPQLAAILGAPWPARWSPSPARSRRWSSTRPRSPSPLPAPR
jgi:MFS transporter, DHA3 family, tetracycline resistance protein